MHTPARKLVLAGAVAALALPVQAQNLLEEVIVTAQKREQTATDVPLSITAYSEEFLQSVGIEDFERLSAFVPGLVVQEQSPNNPAFVIRGITSDTGSAQRQSRVSIYQDGIDISRARGAVVDLYDIERVEVVKGPQATLFGSAASVGAISVISNKPTDELQGSILFGLGNYDERKLSGMISGPLAGDKLRARLSFLSGKRDGYIKNRDGDVGSARPGGRDARDLNGKDTLGARLILDSRPVDPLLLEFIAQYQKDTPPGTAFKSAVLEPVGGTTDPSGDAELGPNGAQSSGYLGGRLGVDRDVQSYTFTTVYETEEAWSFTGIANYREFDSYEVFDADGSWSNLLQAAEDAEGEQWSIEVRANYDDGERWAGFIGASVFDEDGYQRAPTEGDTALLTPLALACILDDCDATTARNLLAGPESGVLYAAEFTNFGETRTYSVYADATYRLTDTLGVTLGGRYVSYEKTSGYAATSDFSLLRINFGETGNDIVESDEETSDAFLPRFIIDWDATENTKLYFNLGRGHSSEVVDVGPNPLAVGLGVPEVVTTIIDEETVDNIELGFKSVLDDGNLVLEGSAFYQIYSDFQTSIIDGLQEITVTVDEATQHGLELSVNYAPTDNWFTFINAGWIDSELENDDVDNDLVNFDGNRFRLQPETTLSAGVRYSFAACDGFFDTGAYWDYRSSVFFEESNAPVVGIPIKQGSYSVWSLRAGFSDGDERFRVQLYVNNLLDEEFVLDGGNTGGSLGSPTFISGPPRMYGGEVTWFF
ncbi:MAG: TonB-dependent receptor [Halioglobus sp.]|nr:TonB-dependent receptor [Halioglobus sp.]